MSSGRLVRADRDRSNDLYLRAGGTTRIVSQGPTGGNGGGFAAVLRSASANGSRAFFDTRERLVRADHDDLTDIYQYASGRVSLISQGPRGADGEAIFQRSSANGYRVFFLTDRRLVNGDQDSQLDVYQRHAGVTTLVSKGPTGGNGAFGATLAAIAAGGTRVFFFTAERLTADDTDDHIDVYERSDGTTTLVTQGETGGNGPFDVRTFQPNPDGSPFQTSPDGTRSFFSTDEPMVAGDTDTAQDIYERSGGTTELVSTGPDGGNADLPALLDGLAAGGTKAFFSTTEMLTSDDLDPDQRDAYERSGGTTTLTSRGATPPAGDEAAFFAEAPGDGSNVYFTTRESLEPGDTDQAIDIYERSGNSTSRISQGPAGGNGNFTPLDDAYILLATPNGHVFFLSHEKLTPDAGPTADFYYYERFGGTTTLISRA
jgi:hypothetical protein